MFVTWDDQDNLECLERHSRFLSPISERGVSESAKLNSVISPHTDPLSE